MSAKNVESLFKLFLQLRDVNEGTQNLYQTAMQYFVACLGDRPVSEITPLDCQIFVKQLSQRTNTAGESISPVTVNIYLRCMRTFFRWLADTEVVAKNPFRCVRNLRATLRPRQLYEDAEIEAILRACPDDRWRLIVALAATAGMRRGEILNLTVPEVDFVSGVITLQPKSDTQHTWFWDVKDHECRGLPITDLTERLLLGVFATLPDGQPYVCLTQQRYKHLQGVRNDGVLPYKVRQCPENNFNRKFRTICGWAGVACRTFHAMRGTCLTIMGEKGLQPHELQRIAGHASVETTYRHYVRPRNQYIENARSAAFNGRYWT